MSALLENFRESVVFEPLAGLSLSQSSLGAWESQGVCVLLFHGVLGSQNKDVAMLGLSREPTG